LPNERTETVEVNIYIKNSRPSCGVENGAGKSWQRLSCEIPGLSSKICECETLTRSIARGISAPNQVAELDQEWIMCPGG